MAFVWRSGTRRRWLAGTGAMLGGAAGAACGPLGGDGGTGAQKPAAPVTIDYFRWNAPETPLGQAQNELAATFNARGERVQVNLSLVPAAESLQKFITLQAAGTPPDSIMVESADIAYLAVKGALTPLDPLARRDDRELKRTEFFPQMLEIGSWKGQLQALPHDVAVFAQFYNRDLFRQGGVAEPKPDWTWDDWLAAMQKLTKDVGDGGKQFGGNLPLVEYVLRAWGGDYLNKDGTECALDSAPAIEAIQWVADLRHRYNVVARPDQLQGTNEAMSWYTGRLASLQSGPWMAGNTRQNAQFKDWDVALIPRGKAARVTRLFSAYIVIPKGVRDAEASWSWVKFYKSTESESLLAQKGSVMPTRKPVADSGAFLTTPPNNIRAFVDMVQYGRHLPQVPRWSDIVPIINQGLAPVLNGQKSAREAVGEIKRQVDPLLKEPVAT